MWHVLTWQIDQSLIFIGRVITMRVFSQASSMAPGMAVSVGPALWSRLKCLVNYCGEIYHKHSCPLHNEVHNEVTARGTLATAVPSEEVMTSSPGIPPPAVLWHHHDQEVCVTCESCATVVFLFFQLQYEPLPCFTVDLLSVGQMYLWLEWQGLKLEMVVWFLSEVLQTSQV